MSIETRIQAINDHLIDDYKVLRLAGADLTGVNKNIVNLKMSWKERLLYFMNNGTDIVWNNWNKVSGTGTTLSINGTVQAPMSLVYKGNTSQTGTPTPSSPVSVNTVSGDNSIEVCGKNLWNNNFEIAEYNSSGVKTTTTVWLVNTTKIKVQPNTTYTVSQKEHPIQYRLTYFNGNTFLSQATSTQQGTTGYSSYTFTTPNNCNGVYIQFRSTIERIAQTGSSVSLGNITEVQLELGNQATTYEEYKGASYPISLSSKNLFNPTYELATQYATNGSVSSGYDKAFDDIFISKHVQSYGRIFFNKLVLKPGTYTLSFKASFSGSTKDLRYSIRDFVGVTDVVPQTSMIISNDNTYSFNFSLTGTNDRTIGISLQPFDSTCGTLYLSDIQLEKDGLTSYEPYFNPIELCKIGTYQDKIFKNTPNTTDYDSNLEDNLWYLKKEIGRKELDGITDGKKATGTYTYNNLLGVLIERFLPYSGSRVIGMCNRSNRVGEYFNSNAIWLGVSTTNMYWIGVLDTLGMTTTDQFNTWLQSNETYLYYPLQTPIYETITDTTLISQLEALKKSYDSQTNISQTNNDLPFELSVTALEVMS